MQDADQRWLDLVNLISRRMGEIEIPREGPIPWVPKWLRKISRAEAAAADNAVNFFSENWRWPRPLEKAVSYQLYFRCLFAIYLFSHWDGEHRLFPKADYGTVLRGVLILAWRENGIQWADDQFPLGRKSRESKRGPLHGKN